MLHIIQKQAKDKNDEDNLNPKGKVMIEFLLHTTQVSQCLYVCTSHMVHTTQPINNKGNEDNLNLVMQGNDGVLTSQTTHETLQQVHVSHNTRTIDDKNDKYN